MRLSSKKNKDKVKLSVNVILDKFLRETVALNIILFAQTKEVLARKSDATNHSNHHLVVNNIIDISKFV